MGVGLWFCFPPEFSKCVHLICLIMKPFRLVLFLIVFVYLTLLVIVSMNLTRTLNWITNHQESLPYITLTGMGVFLLLFFLSAFERSLFFKRIARKEAEKNEIKAQVYDMQRRNDEIEQELHSFEKSLDRPAPPLQPESPKEQPDTNERL